MSILFTGPLADSAELRDGAGEDLPAYVWRYHRREMRQPLPRAVLGTPVVGGIEQVAYYLLAQLPELDLVVVRSAYRKGTVRVGLYGQHAAGLLPVPTVTCGVVHQLLMVMLEDFASVQVSTACNVHDDCCTVPDLGLDCLRERGVRPLL